MHTVDIFMLAESSLSADAASIVVAAMQVFATLGSVITIERMGRRLLLLISCLVMTISLTLLGSFYLFQQLNYNITFVNCLPIVALSTFTIFFSAGLGPVADVVTAEVFTPKISNFARSLVMILVSIFSFMVVKLFPFALQLIGDYGCFFFFAVCTAIIFVFTYFFVPETKGRTIDSIIKELNGEEEREIQKSSVPKV